jgi:tetratricopeptide (TPR) repeat protein
MANRMSGLFRRPLRLAALLLSIALLCVLAGNSWAWYQFRAAKLAFNDGDYAAAAARLRQCRKVWPNREDVQLWSARTARWQGDLPAAEQHLRNCRKSGTAGDNLQLEWLLLRAMSGEVDDLGPGLWKTAESGHPQASEILATLTKAYASAVRYSEAMLCVEKWLDRDPDSIRALEWRAWIFTQLERPKDAISDYEKVLAQAPRHTVSREHLAELHLGNSSAEMALREYEILHQADAANPKYRVGKARALLLLGRLEEASQILEQVLREQPDDLTAMRVQATVHQSMGQWKEAESMSRRLLGRDPSDLQAQYILYLSLVGQADREAEAKTEQQRYDHLCKALERIHEFSMQIERYQNDADKMAEFGALLLEVGREDKGLFWLNLSLKRNPKCAPARKALAEYYETRDPAKAKTYRDGIPP